MEDNNSESDDDIGLTLVQNRKPIKKEKVKDKKKNETGAVRQNTDNNYDNGDPCAICLCNMEEDIGSPDMCDHSFCLECILEWAKTNNSCPKDRITFLQVFVRRKIGGKIVKVIPIEEVRPDNNADEEIVDDGTFCEVCGRADREDVLLLCDECNSGYHIYCLTPPLSSVPTTEEWFCPGCESVGFGQLASEHLTSEIDMNEVDMLLSDGEALTRNLPPRRDTYFRRAIPRTRASERVRARITVARTLRASILGNVFRDEALSDTSLNNLPIPSTSGVASSSRVKKRRKTRKKVRRKPTKGKVRKQKSTKTVKGTKKRKVKTTTRKRRTTTRKRRTKGKVKRSAKRTGRRKILKRLSRNHVLSTPKSRIAEVLGIKAPKKPGQLSLPQMKKSKESCNSSVSKLRMQKYNAGVPSLSLLGSNSTLDYDCDIDDEGGDGLVVGVRRNAASSSNAMARRKAAAILRRAPTRPRPTTSFSSNRSTNILDCLIEKQSNLLTGKYSWNDHGNVNLSKVKSTIKKCAHGESGSPEGTSEEQGRRQSRDGRDGEKSAAGCEISGGKDPTGAKAYSSYLRERSRSENTTDCRPQFPTGEVKKKKVPKEKTEEDVDLYSDVEPEPWEDDLNSMSSPEEDNKSPPRNDQEDDPSSEDDLVIDDSVNTDINRKIYITASEQQCEGKALPGMQEYDEFGLEEVSDTEVQDLEKSLNSSISLSDSNIEEAEVINCDESDVNGSNVGMGLGGLEVETISDSEESFEDENIEEGEIFCEVPTKLPLVRPLVNLQFKKPLEMIASSKEFDGDYEEGEIVDENASASAKRDRREKAKEEVNKVVNQPLDEPSEEAAINGLISNVPLPVGIAPIANMAASEENDSPTKRVNDNGEKERDNPVGENHSEKKQDVSFKKVSRNTKDRNYRDNDKDPHSKRKDSKDSDREEKSNKDKSKRKWSQERNQKEHNKRRRGRTKDKDRDKLREPKRKELVRYNVRNMINKKEEERKKKDEFGRGVSLRDLESSRSRTPPKRRRSGRRSRSRSKHGGRRSSSRGSGGRRRKRSYSSSSSSSSSSSGSSSSFSSSSTSSSRSTSSSPPRKKRDHRRPDSNVVKKIDRKREVAKLKEKSKEKFKTSVIPPDKKDNKKDKRCDTEDIKVEKYKKKRRRGDKSPLQSKEVFRSGGSIMVSVNFARNQLKEGKEKKKEKDPKLDTPVKTEALNSKAKSCDLNTFAWTASGGDSPTGKRTPLQDEPMWSPDNINEQNKVTNSPDARDMDIIMMTPPPQEPILISDSDDEGITRLPPDLGAKPVSPQMRNQGPKTPPEPAVKFTLSTKQNLKPITNPLGGGGGGEGEEEGRLLNISVRGPNTPPGPPPESDESGGRVKSPRMPHSRGGKALNSSPEPDVYDPFEPTKSPSPQTSPPQSVRDISKETIEICDSPEKGASPSYASNHTHITPPPPLPSDPPETQEKPPEPQKLPEEDARPIATIPAINVSPAASAINAAIVHPPALFPSSAIPLTQNANIVAQAVVPMQQIFASLPSNVANILYPAALAAVRGAANNLLRPPPVSQSILTPDLSRPPPPTGLLPPVLISPHNNAPRFTDKVRANQNGKLFPPETELGSPTSPDSSDASDIFEPPSPHRPTNDKISPRKQRPSVSAMKKPSDRFDTLFGNEGRLPKGHQKNKQHTPTKASVKSAGKLAAELDEEIPNSAVDLQVKEKYLKKIQRQERVVEEVKLCLKPFYNKKTITKDDYKDIMKKCVQKVCHNKSGEINPIKIRSLVEGYIKKAKYYRKKFGGLPGSLAPPGVSDPPPPGFNLSKSHSAKAKP